MTPLGFIVGVAVLRPSMVVEICPGPPASMRSRIWDILWNISLAIGLAILVMAACVAVSLSRSPPLSALTGYVAGAVAVMVFLSYKR